MKRAAISAQDSRLDRKEVCGEGHSNFKSRLTGPVHASDQVGQAVMFAFQMNEPATVVLAFTSRLCVVPGNDSREGGTS